MNDTSENKMEQRLLSICIPTYNRSAYLRKCLESITGQEGFDDEVEVVISDNCSTDDTESVGMEFDSKYPNVHYYRNEDNIVDENIILSIERARGILRKLSNDTVIFKSGAILYLKDTIKKYIKERPLMYYLCKDDTEDCDCANADQFIERVGMDITWIRPVAFWEDDAESLKLIKEKTSTNLSQVYFLMDSIKKRQGAVVFDKNVFSMQEIDTKDLSYGLFRVFYYNLLDAVRPCCSHETYEGLRKRILFDFFLTWIPETEVFNEKYILSDENIRQSIKNEYKKDSYYLYFRYRLWRRKCKRSIKRFLQ